MTTEGSFLAMAGNCGNRSSFGRPKLRAATSRQHCRTESPAIESRRIDAVWTERNLPARSQPPGECRALCFPNRPSQILPLRTPKNRTTFCIFYTSTRLSKIQLLFLGLSDFRELIPVSHCKFGKDVLLPPSYREFTHF